MSVSEGLLLAIDPGFGKSGLAVVDGGGALVAHEVVATPALVERVRALVRQLGPTRVLLGDGTSSRHLRPMVLQALDDEGSGVSLEVVSERNTTERARQLYWRRNPPRGLRRLLPLGLQVPPEPYDDMAAWCLALDYLGRSPA